MTPPDQVLDNRKTPPSRRLLEECRDLAASHLGRVLPTLMDRVDDALFDLSDKSESNEAQSVYFDAMREVRLKRPGIEAAFKVAFLAQVNERLERRARRPAADEPAADFGEEDFRLVEEEDLEESLAVTNMASKIRSLCRRQLFGLEKRLALLLEIRDLGAEDNPLGPEVVCRAFREACREIESGIKVKLLVLKLFDRFVTGEVEAVYAALNELLVARDVLPSIRATVQKQPGSPRPAAVRGPAAPQPDTAATGAGESVAAGVPLATVHPLPVSDRAPPGMAPDTVAGSAAGAGGGGTDVLTALLDYMRGSGPAGGAAGEPGDGVERTQLLSELTSIQRGPAAGPGGDEPGASPQGALDTSALLSLKSDPRGVGLGAGDEMLLDIVAMLFDYILDDKDLPERMKALLGRLQIPILKVAILDKSFFARRFHPARKLLNQLAESALGWSESGAGDDALFARIADTVNRVLDEFDDDVGLFAELSAEFETFLTAESEQAEENVRRSTELAERQERLALAKREAARVVRAAMAGDPVPTTVELFLTRYWDGLLVVTWFNEGPESEAWVTDCRTVERLVWSIRPRASESDRRELVSALPDLLKRLQEGMERIAMPTDERDALIADLASCHAAVVKPAPRAAGEATPDGGDGGRVVSIDAARAASAGPPEPPPGAEAPGTPGASAGAEAPEDDGDAPPAGSWPDAIRTVLEDSNRAIFEASTKSPRYQGMGTTVVTAAFDRGRIWYAHVGDSRLYRLRGGRLECLTRDHSVAQELIDRGFYTPEEAEKMVNKNIVTRGMGVAETVEPDLADAATEIGDLYLACSDGLSDMITDEQTRAILRRYADDLEVGAEKLVAAANDAGGKDNISVIIARVPEPAGRRWFGKRAARSRVDLVCRSDVGRKRSHNEDSVAADPVRGIFVLADGMGGMRAGEVASAMAIQSIMDGLEARADAAPETPAGDGAAAVVEPAAPDAETPVEAREGADAGAPPGDAAPPAGEPAGEDRDIDLFAIEIPAEAPVAPEAEATLRGALAPLAGDPDPPVVGPDDGIGAQPDATARYAAAASGLAAGSRVEGSIEEIEITSVGERGPGPEEDEHDRAAQALEVGTWLAFNDEHGRAARARLAWVSRVTNRYLFTDRRGMKVSDKSGEGLAVELRRGSARIIERVPLYDRAVSSLMERLKGTEPAPSMGSDP